MGLEFFSAGGMVGRMQADQKAHLAALHEFHPIPIQVLDHGHAHPGTDLPFRQGELDPFFLEFLAQLRKVFNRFRLLISLKTGEMPLEVDPKFYDVPHSIPSESSLQKDLMED
jgi:hypothetical protein